MKKTKLLHKKQTIEDFIGEVPDYSSGAATNELTIDKLNELYKEVEDICTPRFKVYKFWKLLIGYEKQKTKN